LKLGPFSDIHCNLTGLQRALELLDDGDELQCYVYPADQADTNGVAEGPADVFVPGHTHQAFPAWLRGTLIVNPGLCGASRDPFGLITCAALDVASREVNARSFSA
jgi:predicted phosphodiesterase